MTCKDCVHYEVCNRVEKQIVFTGSSFEKVINSLIKCCRHFKNKADFVEVKHGYWRDTEYGTCSVCNRSISEIYDADSSMAYGVLDELTACPYCGADMREEGADNG